MLVLLFVALLFILRGDIFYVLPCVILLLCFSVILALRLPRLGKRELILVLFVRLFDLRLFGLSVSSSSWCLGRAAICDCGTPWTVLLPFFPRTHTHICKRLGHLIVLGLWVILCRLPEKGKKKR